MLNYFGHSDANDEVKLRKYFFQSPLFNQIKKGPLDEGKFVVHGIKGAGKTAICNVILEENSKEMVCKIDKTFGFDVSRLGEYSAPIEGLMTSLLLKELANQIRARKSELKDPEAVSRLSTFGSTVKTFLEGVKRGTKLEAGPVKIDLEKVLTGDLTRFSRYRIGEYADALKPALQEKRGYILVDDVDEVFTGADKNAAFIEGLMRAVKEINKSFGSRLHCLVFLKSGLFKLFFENAKEYDKLRDFVVSISWGRKELAELLAVRIREKRGMTQNTAHWKAWQAEFESTSQTEVEAVQKYIIDRCVSGPRDLIVFCNMAKEAAGSKKITRKDIEEIEGQYSREKLAQINRDFGTTYPKIFEFLQQVFAAQQQAYTNIELKKLLSDKVVASEPLHVMFSDLEYVRFATKENLLELLYGIGFLGFKRAKNAETEFVITNPDPGSKILNGAVGYNIHDAYKECLNLDS